MTEEKTTTNKISSFIFPINLIDLIICTTLGVCLCYSFYSGSGSETIIGIFGGYLGANAKNAATKGNTTNTTTVNEAGSIQNTTHNPIIEPPKPKDKVEDITNKISYTIDESREMLDKVEKVNNTVQTVNNLKDIFKK